MSDNQLEYLSSDGFERVKKELAFLRTQKRKEISERIEYAKGLGDLSENSEYQEAKEEQLSNETRIAELESLLIRAVLISKNNTTNVINLGSTVVVKKDGSDYQPEEYIIVGSKEADPKARKISNESPLGQAFLGRKKGEKVNILTPKGQICYHIIGII